MARPRLRPTFEIAAELPAREIRERIKASADEARSVVATLVDKTKIELFPDPEAVHLWSPQLTLVLTEEDGHTNIRARFSPHPNVWTFYVAIHALGAFGTLGAGMFGLSQHLAGERPWALYALPIAPVLAALVWALAFVGQGLGAEQMYTLRRFVEEALEEGEA